MSKKILNSELNRKTVEDFKRSEKTPLIIILDDVRSLNNIGSVFRTADAFLVEKIYLCGITACPPHKEIHKTALGATDTVAWAYCTTVEEAISELRQENIEIWSIEQVENAVMLNEFKVKENQKHALIFGNEVKGVSEKAIELSDGCIEIPQLGTKHSLNISVSTGIVVWDFAKKLCNFG